MDLSGAIRHAVPDGTVPRRLFLRAAERHEQGHPYWHGVARLVIATPWPGGLLQLVSAHLASSSAIRLAEAEALALIAKGDLRPTVGHVSGLRYRRDRVYTTLPVEAIVSYQVIEEYEPASDHRPVVATFDLDAVNSKTR
jgi:endonuclease/exonuclease/phosphatase family metal-dependent hydrolase